VFPEDLRELAARALDRVLAGGPGLEMRVGPADAPNGWQRSRLHDSNFQGEDLERNKAGADPVQRLKDMERDGVDAEIIFPNKGLMMWATPEPQAKIA